jgi:translation initiation factor 2 subunit 1
MSQIKEGTPEESEIVICTVTNIQYNSVFVKLDEYKNLQGMIHISEISPGRIRNLRDFVKEGKVIVCKILKINKERGHIDLSLRRVNENQRRAKLEGIKLEQKAEKIIEFAAKTLEVDKKILLDEVSQKIKDKYEDIYSCFEDVVENDAKISDLGFDEKTTKVLTREIKQKIKPASVLIEGIMTITSYKPNGIEIVKEAVNEALKVDESLKIHYGGGGNFKVMIEAPDYKTAEKILKEGLSIAEAKMKENDSDFVFVRKENKK